MRATFALVSVWTTEDAAFEPYLWSHSTRPPRPRLSRACRGEEREENITISWHVYLLRLDSGCIYVGSTHHLERRLQEHRSGYGCRTTSTSATIELIYSEPFPD